uniref:Restriction endonuclease type I HsdR N-terminal domain-containing protein n=1 Tax=Klebsiella pneumoniae TaxID=573 RepID=A0A2P1BPB9_KLEPN|nr:hypothetical protein [Klebsiella pneumoniae]
MPELKYHPAREFAIDLVLFINGSPVATVELKTDFTQSCEAAMDQYRNDRLPYDAKTKRREPLLTFKRGAVVHFAMSDSEIMMATKLDGENTFSCRSIRGARTKVARYMRVTRREIKADGTREYPVAYFWRRSASRMPGCGFSIALSTSRKRTLWIFRATGRRKKP